MSLDEYRFESLLDPISAESPAGGELSPSDFSSPIYQLREERDRACASIALKLNWQIGRIDDSGYKEAWYSPNWDAVIEKSLGLLAAKTKDLRVLAWLVEGVTYRYGLSGVSRLMPLALEFCRRYWEVCYPRPNENGHLDAMATWSKAFGDAMIRTFEQTPLFQTDIAIPGQATVALTYNMWQNREAFGKITDEKTREDRKAQFGWISPDDWSRAMERVAVSQLRVCFENAKLAQEATASLVEFFKENCQPDQDGEPTAPIPPLSNFSKSVGVLLEFCRDRLKDRGESTEVVPVVAGGLEATEANEGAVDEIAGVVPTMISSGGSLQPGDREEAFRRMEQLAVYFEKYEPHSPIHFGLRQLVRWGRLRFPELMRELLEDEDKMMMLSKRIGMENAPREMK